MANTNEFTVEVYACDGSVSQTGYNNYNKGMVYFDYGNYAMSSRGESSSLARGVATDLEINLRKYSGVNVIKFGFPKSEKSVSHYADGFFGRLLICTGSTFLRPLCGKRRIALSRKINNISMIKDKWGREIKLIA